MKCYELWGTDATNMTWYETYTALQQKTVDGQENPLPAIDAASVQEVQKYVSLWNANYDCLFFCINQGIYDSLTQEQQKVVDEAGRKAVAYEREINRAGDEEILERWQSKNGVTITNKEDMDIDSFKKAVCNSCVYRHSQIRCNSGIYYCPECCIHHKNQCFSFRPLQFLHIFI